MKDNSVGSCGVVFPVSQSLGSERPRIRLPLTFARQQLPQLACLQHMEACSIPAELVLLPPGTRDRTAAASILSLPEGLSVCRYDSSGSSKARHEYHSHGLIQSHKQCKLMCEQNWFLVGLAVEKGILQLLCSERLPGAAKDTDKGLDSQQRGSKRSRRESLTHSDDSATDVTIQDTHPQHKQHKPQHHLGALQDWQLHRAGHPTAMQLQDALPGSAAHLAEALLAVQEPSVMQQHRPHPQPPLQAHTQQHMRAQQQHSLGVQPLLHDLQDTLEPSSHLPPRHRPAGSSRAGSHTASGDVQHHSPGFGQRKKVTWADEGSAPSRLGTAVAAVPEAAAAAPAEGGVQSGNLAGGLGDPNAQLWQNLLLLQQLQQLSALPAPELQQLLQELTELDNVWRHSSTCGAWSGRAGSCTGRACCSSHIPNQPTQHYKERLLLMKRYGILPGAAGQFEVQHQHVQAVLAAVQAPRLQQDPCQDAFGAQHSGFLQDYAPPVKHSDVAAAAPAGSDSSAHTCNTA